MSEARGGVTLVEFDTGEFVPVEGTEALLVGDELRLSPGARAEVQLADRNLLRLAEQAEIGFLTLAGSPDRTDRVTALRLRRGALQVVVGDRYEGESPPEIETLNAYVELRGPGSYVVDVRGPDRTLVIVREGSARVRAGTAVTPLRTGEEAVVEGSGGERVRLAVARAHLAVERWGDELSGRYAGVTEVYIDESIQYAAARLRPHGTWVSVRGTRAWRPRVKYGWRPYTYGRWRYTPTGVLWVSYEPWGWVPHHYGSWDLVPGYGWVWFPGRRFASAWVYWYWGPKYVGWVPWGYYTHRYRSGFYFGVYGMAGGLAVRFGDWCFTPIHRFGHRYQRDHIRYGKDLGRDGERIAKGVITTDTRGVTPIHWVSPDRVSRVLTYDDGGGKKSLEDVSAFIDRRSRQNLTRVRETAADRGSRTRASIDPVRPGPTVELPSNREPAALDRETGRTPLPTPVRSRPTVEVPSRTRPTVEPRSGSRPTVKVPTRTRPTVEPRSGSRPTVKVPTRTRPTVEPRSGSRPTVKVPTRTPPTRVKPTRTPPTRVKPNHPRSGKTRPN